jgi:hypothetical protein
MGSAPNWLARSWYTDQNSPIHQADPAHFGRGDGRGATDPGAYAYQAPPAAALIDGVDYIYGDDVWDDAMDVPGQILDTTPTDPEQGAGSLHPHPDYNATGDLAYVEESMAAHSESYGAEIRATRAYPAMYFDRERWLIPRFETFGPGSMVDPITSRRGLNGLPENNPDGFRPGLVEQSWVDRKLYIGERVHDARMVTPNTAAAPVNAPAPTGNTSSSNSPFDSLARGLPNIWQRPLIRREQPGITEAVLDDGLVYAADEGQWVVD